MNRPLVIALAVTLPVIAYQYYQNSNFTSATDTTTPRSVDIPVHPSPGTGDIPVPTTVPSAENPTLKSILTSPDPTSRLSSLFAYAESVPVTEIGAALAELRATTRGDDPEALITAHILLTRWGTEDPAAALAHLAEADIKRAYGDGRAILAAYASGNPQRAVAWLGDPDNQLASQPKLGHVLAGTIANEWARTDPDAALAWAASLPEGQSSGAHIAILRNLASRDPALASFVATSLEPGGERTRAIAEVSDAWASQDPDAALTWAATLDGEERHQATRQSLDALTDIDPQQAATYLESITDAGEQARLLTTVAGSWAETQPAEAATWLADRPESDGKTDAMGWVAWHWTNADPQAASTWLIDQPESQSRDRAIGSLAKATFESDPAAAVTWAAQITDPQTRDQSLTRGLTEWEKR
ncbi:MAG: hypothetical protein P8J87_17365, partial [Verrucomicrobiales bacterium]|nr:hypothetical protein [Verrucomicrobiales bacterium]